MQNVPAMKIVNLTPHDINVVLPDGVRTYPRSGKVARCSVNSALVGEIDGVPIFKTVMGEVVDLPEKEEGTTLIVSVLVKEKVKRDDLVSPSSLVRDDKGNVIGCRGFDC